MTYILTAAEALEKSEQALNEIMDETMISNGYDFIAQEIDLAIREGSTVMSYPVSTRNHAGKDNWFVRYTNRKIGKIVDGVITEQMRDELRQKEFDVIVDCVGSEYYTLWIYWGKKK